LAIQAANEYKFGKSGWPPPNTYSYHQAIGINDANGGTGHWMSQRVITLFENRNNYEYGPIRTVVFFRPIFWQKRVGIL